MDRRLQIHVLRNIRDNQGWDWGPGWVMTETGEAAIRFQQSGFTDQEYFGCGLALIASGKVVSGLNPGTGLENKRDPRGLTIEGYEYLRKLEHPLRYWMRRNWFPVAVAASTFVASVGGIGIELWSKMSGA